VRWLLDTNVLSESIKPQPDRTVARWMAMHSPDQMAISIVTLAELNDGVQATPGDKRKKELVAWLENFVVPSFQDRILPLAIEILVDWLALARSLQARGRPQMAADLLIAATARIHDLIVVTRDVRHFALTETVIYNPWTGETHNMDSS
jgi:predicted nucleic acid-binding protein